MKKLLLASILLVIVNNLYALYIAKIINLHPGDEFWYSLITGVNFAYALVVLSYITTSKKKPK